MSYPVTPTLSVEASHRSDVVLPQLIETLSPVGTDGAVVSSEAVAAANPPVAAWTPGAGPIAIRSAAAVANVPAKVRTVGLLSIDGSYGGRDGEDQRHRIGVRSY